jgi:hypothetical protein
MGRLSNPFVRRALTVGACLSLAVAVARCSSSSGDPCRTDADGIIGGASTIQLTVSDTAFSVGAADSGSVEPNIVVQNLSRVTLTLTNVGTRPHDFVIRCLPTPNAAGCPTESCFPPEAGLGPVAPGGSATTTFMTPAVEGAYPFVSDQPGDSETAADGGPGLLGEFVLM